MEHVFKTMSNHQVVDLIPYLKGKIAENKDVDLYIGCDSQNDGGKTKYACVIVLHYPRNGGHVLFMKHDVERIKDKFSKLWKEVEISVEVALYLEKHGIHAKYVDIDLNPDPKFGSNSVLRSAAGFVESNGFVPRAKPYALAASYAADKLCK